MKSDRTFPRLSSALPALLLALGVSLALKVGWRIVDSRSAASIVIETSTASPDACADGFQATARGSEHSKKDRDAPPAKMVDAAAEALVTSSSPHVPAPDLASHGTHLDRSESAPSRPGALRVPAPDESRPPGASFEQRPFAPRAPPFVAA